MTKKVILTLISIFLVLLLNINYTSALDFDNGLFYDDGYMNVTITNRDFWGIGDILGIDEKLGEIELKSHRTLTEIRNVIAGKDRTVMYYDFKDWELYKNGLGEVYFTDEKTGMPIEKSYYFAEAIYEERDVMKYQKVCLKDVECYREEIGYKKELVFIEWRKLETNDIPNYNVRIGLITDVLLNDYVDGIWTIAGNKVKKHATWTSSFEDGLIAYYNASSQIEQVQGGDFNYTIVGGGLGYAAGKLGNAWSFDGAGDKGNILDTSQMYLDQTNNFTISFWGYVGASGSIFMIGEDDDGWYYYSSGGNQFQLSGSLTPGGNLLSSARTLNIWYHLVIRREGTNVSIWKNNAAEDSDNGNGGINTPTLFTFANGIGTIFTGRMDEIGFWNRSLSDSEISDLYNAGTGISRDSLDFETPDISYSAQTPADYTSTINTSLYINVSITESNFENMSYNLYNSTLNTTDLVLYLPLDRDSTTQRDISGQGNDGTVTGAVFNSSGKLNGAYEFNRSHYISITDDDSLSFSNSSGMTISLWAKSIDAGNWTGIGSGNNYRHLLGKGAEGNYEYWLRQVNGTTGSTLTFTVSNRTADVTTSSQVNNVFESANWEYITMGMNATDTFIYLNGILKDSDRLNGEITFENGNQPLDLGKRSGGSGGLNFNGTIDEVMIFNRSLSSGEISALYNRSAVNRTMFTTETLEIDWLGLAANDYNYFVDVWDNGEYYNFTKIRNYNSYVDSIFPTIILTSPSKNIPYGYINKTIYVNWTLTETNPSACWYDYNGTNQSVTCGNNNFSFPIESYENRNLTFFANDTSGNQNESFTSWDYNIFQNSIEYKSKSYETQGETFAINLAANSSLSSVNLIYNGTSYSTTNSGGNYSKFLTLSDSNFGNNTFYWNFTYAGNEIKSDTYYQNVSYVNFTKCDGIFTIPYLNFTFKDEGSSTLINATIPTSTFVYYLGGGSVNKSYTYINNSVNMNYTFCASPVDESLKVDMYVQYKSLGYPQRIYNPVELTLPNTTLEKTLYLLATVDGIYVYFNVFASSGSTLQGVEVNASRVISGDRILVGQGTTDSSGSVNFWINPDYSHKYTFYKSGYDLQTETLTIGDSTPRVVRMGGGTVQPPVLDYQRQIGIIIKPSTQFLVNDTTYNFNYTITTAYWTFDSWGFILKYGNGSIIGTKSSTLDTGGRLDLNANTFNQTRIIMDYYYVINSTYTNKSKTWQIDTIGSFGIYQFTTRLNSYISANMLGILGDSGTDYFGKALISVVILVLVTGGMTLRYGLRSDTFALGIMFGLVMFLNSINFIPNPDFLVGTNINLGDFLVFVIGVIIVGFIIKEELR